jgi:hypothetical protein
MAKIERMGNYGDQMHGVIVQPHQVSVVGVVDAAGRFLIAVRVLNDAGDTLTIALPLDFEPTFRRMLKEQAAEMRDIETAPRI